MNPKQMFCYQSIPKTLTGYFFMALFFGFLLRHLSKHELSSEPLVLNLLIAFFVACLVFGIFELAQSRIRKQPWLTINEKGIVLHASFIPWENIDSLTILERSHEEVICIHLKDSHLYLSKFSPFKRFLISINPVYHLPIVGIDFTYSAVGCREVWEFLLHNYSYKTKKRLGDIV